MSQSLFSTSANFTSSFGALIAALIATPVFASDDEGGKAATALPPEISFAAAPATAPIAAASGAAQEVATDNNGDWTPLGSEPLRQELVAG